MYKTITIAETDGIMVAGGLRAEARRNREAAVKADIEFPGAAKNMRYYAAACERIADVLDARGKARG